MSAKKISITLKSKKNINEKTKINVDKSLKTDTIINSSTVILEPKILEEITLQDLEKDLEKAEYEKDEEDDKEDINAKDNFNYYENTFNVIDNILHQRNTNELVNHQHSSYKQFIDKNLDDIIQQFNPRKIYFNYDPNANKHKTEVHIEFLNFNLGRPTIHENDGSFKIMTPEIAKLRNLSYSAPLTLIILILVVYLLWFLVLIVY